MFRSRCTSIVPMTPRTRARLKTTTTSTTAATTEERKPIHMLLLGCGDCGKSTLFKQYTANCSTSSSSTTSNAPCTTTTTTITTTSTTQPQNLFSEDERKEHKYDIYNYLIVMIVKVYEQMTMMNAESSSSMVPPLENEVEVLIKQVQLLFETSDVGEFYDEQLHTSVSKILESKAFQEAIKTHFHTVHCPDGLSYFLNIGMERLSPKFFEPTFKDFLHLRRKSAAIVDKSIDFKGHTVNFTLSSGQRSERRKWISLVQESTVLVFVVSMADYDQHCYEDETKNRTMESLETFEGKPVFLVMNKQDLFKEKYHSSHLSQCFPEFNIEKYPTVEDGVKFLEDQYKQRFRMKRGDAEMNNLIIYQTCATESYSREIFVRMLHHISPDSFNLLDLRKEIAPVRRRSGARMFAVPTGVYDPAQSN